MGRLYIYLPLLFLVLYISSQSILQKPQNLPPSPRGVQTIWPRARPPVLLSPVLLISSLSLAEECFNKKDTIIFASHPSLLSGKRFRYNYASISWCPYGDHWRNLRTIASLDLLSSHRIQMLSQVWADEIRILIRKLFQLANERPDKVVHVKQALFEFIFNVMTTMVCGKKYIGEKVENLKEVQVFQEIINESSLIVPKANVIDFLPFMRWFGFRDVEKRIMLIQEKRDKFMQNVIDQHHRLEIDDSSVQDYAREKKIIAEILLAMQKTEPGYYAGEMIKNLLLVLAQAGSHKSSITVEWYA